MKTPSRGERAGTASSELPSMEPKVLEHTARTDEVRFAARAPPWGPRPSHPWPQRPLQEDLSRSAENLPSCVRDVVGKIDECTRRTAPKARWSLLRCGTSARNSLLPHRGGGREDKARGRVFDAHEEREGLSLGVQGPQGAERQQLVLVGATVPSASEEKGDTSG